MTIRIRVSDLYAALAAHWVAHACFEHFALVSVADAARIDGWFRLSFGLQQIHALLPLDDRDMSPPTIPSGITIRRAGPDDGAILADICDIIWQRHVKAPVWAIHVPESTAETHAG